MLTQTRWKEVDDFEPWNPTQKAIVHYTGLPGGYSTFYYDNVPNETHLFGPDLGVADIDEVPEAYGTIPGVYGPFGVADIDEVPEAYGTIPGVYGPFGAETVTTVPGAYGEEPGIYDPSQHLEILLSGAMGLGAEGAPMSTTSKVMWLSGALALGAAAGFIVGRMRR
jgi:hypothetical protein